MAKENTVRVSAKAEFGSLQRGLKQLQQDLKGVTGVVNKGANKGGFFDENQLKALDIYKQRFTDTMQELDSQFRRQNDAVEQLYEKMNSAQKSERGEIEKTIREREKKLDIIRKELIETERLYNARSRESSNFNLRSGSGSGSGGNGSNGLNADGINDQVNNGIIGKFFKGTAGRVLTAGKMGLGLAGVGGIGAIISQAYGLAYSRQVDSLDLAQRMRGQKGWTGHARDMWDRSGDVGRSDRMGYSSAESWGFLDQYTRTAGNIDTNQQKGLLKFGRAYGLTTSEVAGTTATNRAAGGTSSPKAFADAIAGSVAESGMTPRILEVMETNNALLQTMNTTLKDGSSKQILAYQTTLDRIGTSKGMTQLTGASGGNLISGLGGIFSPENDNWKWMGINALQKYNPSKYGNMDLFDLEESYEDGLLNKDNIPAMTQYIKGISGGNEKTTIRILQRWLKDGGFSATKREASEFYNATDGLTAFSPDQIESMKNGSIDSGAKYDAERIGEKGQGFLDIDAQYKQSLTGLGDQFVGIVNELKQGAGSFVGTLVQGFEAVSNTVKDLETGLGQFVAETLQQLGVSEATSNKVGGTVSNITGYIAENPEEAATAAAGGWAGWKIFNKVKGWLNPASKTVAGAAAASEAAAGGAAGAGIASRILPPVAFLGTAKLSDEAAGGVSDWLFGHKSGQNKTPGLFENPFKNEQWQDDRQGAISKGWNWLWGLDNHAGDSDIGVMPNEIKDNVEDMSLSGKNNFKSMDRSTRDMVDNASTKYGAMEKSTKDLSEKGTWVFSQMLYTVQNRMSDMYHEHQGIKQMISSLLGGSNNSLTSVSSALSGGYNTSSKITDMSGITAAQLDTKLGGALKGKGASFVKYGLQYGIDPAAVAAIAIQETGNGTSKAIKEKNNVGGMFDSATGKLRSFDSVDASIEAMIKNLKNNYVNKGIDTIEAVQRKYAPIGAHNDPDNLNNNWSKGVVNIANGLIGGAGNSSVDNGFFNNWTSRITSRFHATESFRTHAHRGLDINGEQGDKLGALTGGTISFIKMDDGSALDEDGKANTRDGGTEVGVKMADGNTYFYSHLSNVNSGLKVGQKIKTGDWIGNVGGDPGVPGSGKSTTGSHLHLGYMNSNGQLINPEQFLKSVTSGGAGDSDIGYMGGSGAKYQSEITVKLDLTGEGAKTLNGATQSQLEKLVRKIMAEAERQRLRMSPTKVGYN